MLTAVVMELVMPQYMYATASLDGLEKDAAFLTVLVTLTATIEDIVTRLSILQFVWTVSKAGWG